MTTFSEIWLPRIGEKATAILWGIQRNRGLKAFILIGGAFGAPPAVWTLGGVLGLLLGVAGWTAAGAVFAANLSGKRRLAVALSEYFGTPIQPGLLPVMAPAAFDRWVVKKGLHV